MPSESSAAAITARQARGNTRITLLFSLVRDLNSEVREDESATSAVSFHARACARFDRLRQFGYHQRDRPDRSSMSGLFEQRIVELRCVGRHWTGERVGRARV